MDQYNNLLLTKYKLFNPDFTKEEIQKYSLTDKNHEIKKDSRVSNHSLYYDFTIDSILSCDDVNLISSLSYRLHFLSRDELNILDDTAGGFMDLRYTTDDVFYVGLYDNYISNYDKFKKYHDNPCLVMDSATEKEYKKFYIWMYFETYRYFDYMDDSNFIDDDDLFNKPYYKYEWQRHRSCEYNIHRSIYFTVRNRANEIIYFDDKDYKKSLDATKMHYNNSWYKPDEYDNVENLIFIPFEINKIIKEKMSISNGIKRKNLIDHLKYLCNKIDLPPRIYLDEINNDNLLYPFINAFYNNFYELINKQSISRIKKYCLVKKQNKKNKKKNKRRTNNN